jgi:hypothetical protein
MAGQGNGATAPVVVYEAAYEAALELVERIDQDLRQGTGHYRRRDGRLLEKLDEVVLAILSDDLCEEVADGRVRV